MKLSASTIITLATYISATVSCALAARTTSKFFVFGNKAFDDKMTDWLFDNKTVTFLPIKGAHKVTTITEAHLFELHTESSYHSYDISVESLQPNDESLEQQIMELLKQLSHV